MEIQTLLNIILILLVVAFIERGVRLFLAIKWFYDNRKNKRRQ